MEKGLDQIKVILQKLSGQELNEKEKSEVEEKMPIIVKQMTKKFPKELSDCTMDYIKKKEETSITLANTGTRSANSCTLTFRVTQTEKTDTFDVTEFDYYMRSNAEEKGITINGKD